MIPKGNPPADGQRRPVAPSQYVGHGLQEVDVGCHAIHNPAVQQRGQHAQKHAHHGDQQIEPGSVRRETIRVPTRSKTARDKASIIMTASRAAIQSHNRGSDTHADIDGRQSQEADKTSQSRRPGQPD